MKRTALFLLCVCIASFTFSKHNQPKGEKELYYPYAATSHFKRVQLPGQDLEREIRDYLLHLMPSLREGRSGLRLLDHSEGRASMHFRFEQMYDGLPIYGSSIKVNLDKHAKIYSIFLSDFNTDGWDQYALGAQDFDLEESAPYQTFVAEHLADSPFDREIRKAIGYDFEAGEPMFVYHAKFRQTYGSFNSEAIFTANACVFVHDFNVYFAPPDTVATGMVFNPDPLTTAGVTYGVPYIDDNDNDRPELNAERVEKEIKVTINGGVYSLENDYIRIMDFDAPAIVPQTNTTGVFNFTRGQYGFEEVNALYHITEYQEYLQSIGFTDIVNYQIRTDVYALSDQDQSLFSPGSPISSLFFGEGCVDDAEDADVIVHEYGHAISHAAAAGSNIGSERTAIDEGFGDYVAASYSLCLDTFRARHVFSWDGNNQCWPGRNANTNKVYPDDLEGSIHSNGEIWATALMDISDKLGKDLANQIIIESMRGYSQNIGFLDVARLLIDADSMIYGGNNFCGIYPCLLERGLVDSLIPDPCNFKDLSILADAGPDTVVCKNAPVVLGGDPTSLGNDKLFFWTPNQDLDDNRLERPIATPEFDVTYTLRVERPDGFFNDDQISIGVIPCPFPAVFVNSKAFIADEGVMSIVFPFEFEVARVRMFDGLGRLLLDAGGITDKRYDIDPNHFSAGAYIFHVEVDAKEFGKRLVKVK